MSESYGLTKALQDAIAEAEELIANAPFIKTEQDRLEGYDYLAGRIRMAMQMAFDYDLDRPLFVNPTHQFSRQGLDNPDAIYFNAFLREGVEYVVRGRRGTSADLSFQVMGGQYTADSAATSLMAFDDRELDVRPDGSFEFTYVAEPGAKSMIVREVFNDWDTEERGILTIERADRLGQPAEGADPRPAREEVRRRRALAGRLHPDVVRLPAVLPVQGAGQHPDRPAVDARRPGLAAVVDRPLRARRRPGAGDHGAALRRLLLPGRPGRLGLVRLHRLRDPPDLAHQGAGGHRPRRPHAVRGVRAEPRDRELARDHRPPHRRADAALAAARARPHPGGRRPDRRGGPVRRRTRRTLPHYAPITRPRSTPRASPPGSARSRAG